MTNGIMFGVWTRKELVLFGFGFNVQPFRRRLFIALDIRDRTLQPIKLVFGSLSNTNMCRNVIGFICGFD